MGSFSVWHWIIFGMIAAVVFGAFRGMSSGSADGPALFCTSCGHEGPPKKVTRGSFLVEIVLWLCFLLPGLVYSVWRISTRYRACNSCGATTLVPPGSPVAMAQKKALLP